MAGIFISYRRSDKEWAGYLKEHLQYRFGSDLVWQDVEDITPGKQYLDEIWKAIQSSDAFLVLIGPGWKGVDLPRLKKPKDVLRKEIEKAFESKITTIPVLIGGIKMPAKKDLPPSIENLAMLQAVELREDDWEQTVHILIEWLRQIISTKRKRQPLPILRETLDQLQQKYFMFLRKNPNKALKLARDALKLIDEQSPHYPHDIYLQLVRGYSYKNQSMALRDLGKFKSSQKSLQDAEAVFKTIQREEEWRTAGAFNGIGSVEALRGDYKEALQWIDKALGLVPNYGAALHDRKEVLNRLKNNEQLKLY